MPPQQSSVQRDFIFVQPAIAARTQKRKAAPLACDDCRRRKKRCEHGVGATHHSTARIDRSDHNADHNDRAGRAGTSAQRHGEVRRSMDSQDAHQEQTPHRGTPSNTPSSLPTMRIAGPLMQPSPAVATPATATPRVEGSRTTASAGPPSASIDREQPVDEDTGDDRSRFIGDLNPEGELLRATCDSPRTSRKHKVGIWHPLQATNNDSGRLSPPFAPTSLCHHFPPLTQQIFAQVMHEQSLTVLPPAAHFSVIEAFYLSHVHAVLPAIDQTSYQTAPLESPTRILLAQTICLAAHTNLGLRDHLHLPGSKEALPVMAFGQKILSAMRFNIEMSLVADRAVLVRVLATMSFFAYGCDSMELSCQFFVRAVHIAYTIGLHLDRGDELAERARDGLFCYLWSIDRLHAAIQGRPVIIHDHDMTTSAMERSRHQISGLRVMTYTASLLDKVISLYRPNAKMDALSESEFPTFEDMVVSCEAGDMPPALLATMELFYHAVAILSCRPAVASTRAKDSRQSLSALQVVRILDEDSSGLITLLPWVPYAVSLSLSTVYRDFRFGQLALVRERASKLVFANYTHLCRLREAYWSASVMADMAYRLLEAGEDAGHVASDVRQHVSSTTNPLDRNDGSHVDTSTERQHGRNSVYDVTGGTGDGFLGQQSHFWPDTDWNDVDALFEGNLDLSLPSHLFDYDFTATMG